MTADIRVEIVRFLSAENPGFVECVLVDADGKEHRFHEKAPVVSAAGTDETTTYPQPGVIRCTVLGRGPGPAGRLVVEVDTELPWDIESTAGQTRFHLFAEELDEAVPQAAPPATRPCFAGYPPAAALGDFRRQRVYFGSGLAGWGIAPRSAGRHVWAAAAVRSARYENHIDRPRLDAQIRHPLGGHACAGGL
jgi:hypothetical protein